jgi:hypothetical protein
MSKKFSRSYQPKDPSTGEPIGNPQVFEADTQDELIDMLAAAHENASVAVIKTRQAAKVGTLLGMDPDPETPMRSYEEKVITADERVKLAAALKDPANTDHVVKKLMESFGIPVDEIRSLLQEREVSKRQNFANEQSALFVAAHPEFLESDYNNDQLIKYLSKRKLAFTKKNLEIAYADLNGEGLLTVRAPEQPKPAVQVTPAPAPEPAIPAQVTPAAPISAEPTEVRPKLSSSGLGRDNSSAAPGAPAPKAPEITAQDIARLSSKEYSEKLRDPEFRKLVDNLGRKAASS